MELLQVPDEPCAPPRELVTARANDPGTFRSVHAFRPTALYAATRARSVTFGTSLASLVFARAPSSARRFLVFHTVPAASRRQDVLITQTWRVEAYRYGSSRLRLTQESSAYLAQELDRCADVHWGNEWKGAFTP